MNGGYESRKVLASGAPQTVGASATDQPISAEFKISAAGSCRIRIDLIASALTVGAGVTAKLQHATFVNADGTATWTDTKTASLTTTGLATITVLVEVAGDQGFCPLRPNGRVVLTTGAGSSATISDIRVMQEV